MCYSEYSEFTSKAPGGLRIVWPSVCILYVHFDIFAGVFHKSLRNEEMFWGEIKKTSSHRELNPGHLVCVASAVPPTLLWGLVAQWLCTVCTSQVSWVLFPATTGVFTFFYFASKLLKSLFNFTSADELVINLSAMKLSMNMALCSAYSVESDLQITSHMHTHKFKTLGSSVPADLPNVHFAPFCLFNL